MRIERGGNFFDALAASFLLDVGLATVWYSLTGDHATRALLRRFSLSERVWGGVKRVIVDCTVIVVFPFPRFSQY